MHSLERSIRCYTRNPLHTQHGTGEAAVQVSHVPLGTRGQIMVTSPPDNIFERPGRRLTDVINDGTGSEALEKVETKDSMSVTVRGCAIASNYGDGCRVVLIYSDVGRILLHLGRSIYPPHRAVLDGLSSSCVVQNDSRCTIREHPNQHT